MKRTGLWLGFLLMCSAFGCRPAHSSLFQREVTIYVAITPAVAKSDTGNVAAMVDAVEAQLREAGYMPTIVAARADEKPPVPRVEIQVMTSDSGDAQMRGAGNLMGGVVGATIAIANGGSMLVDAYWVPGGTAPARYLRRYRGSSFGAVSEEAVAAGDSVGHSIARDLLK
jgi:hypothetical protein